MIWHYCYRMPTPMRAYFTQVSLGSSLSLQFKLLRVVVIAVDIERLHCKFNSGAYKHPQSATERVQRNATRPGEKWQ